MKRIANSILLSFIAHAAIAQDTPGRAPGYDALQHFVGRWTERGNESTFLEVCAWFDGNFHVVCNAERKRADGSVGRSMSILSYIPSEGYVHIGIGNKGSFDTLQHGTYRGGIFEFMSTSSEGDKSIVTRIRLGPFADHGFPFAVDTSTDGGPWVTAGTTDYVKLE
jgi:hypothetical protein